MQLGQLLTGESGAKVRIAFLDDPNGEVADRARHPIVTRPTTTARDQAGSSTLSEGPQQPEDLPSLQAQQRTRIRNPDAFGLQAEKDIKPGELLVAHRHHRHPARPPAAQSCGGVPSELCRGVSSL